MDFFRHTEQNLQMQRKSLLLKYLNWPIWLVDFCGMSAFVWLFYYKVTLAIMVSKYISSKCILKR